MRDDDFLRVLRRLTRGLTMAVMISALMLMSSCGRDKPETPIVTLSQARTLKDPMQLQVLRVWSGIEHAEERTVTHLVEARVVQGPSALEGRVFCWPYDYISQNRQPPAVGSTITAAPYDFIETRSELEMAQEPQATW